MIPKSLSPTALQVWEACPARYAAETIDRTPMPSGWAADLGTVCHTALQNYVQRCYIDKTDAPHFALLEEIYLEAFGEMFGVTREDLLKDGHAMMKNWFSRSDSLGYDREIVQLETKENFVLKTTAGEINFNYIFDRLDLLPDGSVEVVDYKSIRARLSPEGLKDKIQARAYAVAAQIKYPEAPRVWVTFDLLRYDPVGIVFTREENLATWRYIKQSTERIIATPQEEAPERLNPDCQWCIRKHNCKALTQHVDAGGVLSLDDPLEAAKRRARIDSQIKALSRVADDLDAFILTSAGKDDVDFYEDDEFRVNITARRTRDLKDTERLIELIGPEMTKRYGGVTLTSIDKMLKKEVFDEPTIDEINRLIGYKTGNPSVKVEAKNPID